MISFHDLDNSLAGRAIADVACPLCGPRCTTLANQRAPKLRTWRINEGLASYRCARCGVKGVAYADRRNARPEPDLANRGLAYQGEALRWHPSCPFGKDERLGCMLGLVRNIVTNEPQAIHRTAIDANARKIGRKAYGPVSGGAVKLTADDDVELSLLAKASKPHGRSAHCPTFSTSGVVTAQRWWWLQCRLCPVWRASGSWPTTTPLEPARKPPERLENGSIPLA